MQKNKIIKFSLIITAIFVLSGCDSQNKVTYQQERIPKPLLNTKTQLLNSPRNSTSTTNILPFIGLPRWAKNINITEPRGLTIIPEESSVVKGDGIILDFFNLSYTGNLNTKMQEAKRIARELNLSIKADYPEYFMAKANIQNGKYEVIVSADEEKLSLSAVTIR